MEEKDPLIMEGGRAPTTGPPLTKNNNEGTLKNSSSSESLGKKGQHRRAATHAYGSTTLTSAAGQKNKNGNGKPGHRKNRSSISHLVFNAKSKLEMIGEEVIDTALIVRETFLDEIKDAQQGRTFFLDMAATRSLSIIPEDLPEFYDEARGKKEDEEQEEAHLLPSVKEGEVEEARQSLQLGPYIGLASAVIAFSSKGAAVSLLTGVPQPLKLYWQMLSTASILILFAGRIWYRNGFPKLDSMHWCVFLAAVLCYCCYMLLFFTSLEYTTIGNAVIFSNSQATILILGKALMGQKTYMLEWTGVIVATVGCILCVKDSDGGTESAEDSTTGIFGDALALASAVAGVFYLTFAKVVRPHMGVTTLMFMIMFCGSFVVLGYMVLIGVPLSVNGNPDHGLFGWANPDKNRLMLMAYIAVVCTMVGTMGFVRAMQYFDNLIIAVATLTEPMVASFIAFFCGVGALPGPLGWLGNIFVALGTFAVVYPSAGQKNGGGGH